jgi:hypothetical protein
VTSKIEGVSKRKPPRAGMGRPKGAKNKTTTFLKEAILLAAESAHPNGMTGYLKDQAEKNPVAFMTLLGKVLPMQISGNLTISHEQALDELER